METERKRGSGEASQERTRSGGTLRRLSIADNHPSRVELHRPINRRSPRGAHWRLLPDEMSYPIALGTNMRLYEARGRYTDRVDRKERPPSRART